MVLADNAGSQNMNLKVDLSVEAKCKGFIFKINALNFKHKALLFELKVTFFIKTIQSSGSVRNA